MWTKIKTWWSSVDVVEAAVWGGVAIFLLMGLSTLARAHPAAPALRAQITAPVHKVYDLGGASCSAVMIAPERALTAAHCLNFTAPVATINGYDYVVTEGYAASPRDIAVLIIPGAPCPCAVVADTPAEEGDWLAAVGYPFGLARVVTYGEMQARIIYGEDEQEYILTTTLGAPGNSGGGLFNQYGELVGITALGMVGHSMLAVEIISIPMTNPVIFWPKAQ